MKIALYGGGFDPIHLAHLILAQTAVEALGLDKVIFMPSGGIAHYKSESNLASGPDRVEMIHRAIFGNPAFQVSSYEVDQRQFCYTVDTLRYLRETNPEGSEIFLLVGGDWKNRIATWKEGESILREFKVGVFPRPGYAQDEDRCIGSKSAPIVVDMPLIDISSSEIRRRIREGKSVRYRVPEAVEEYIRERGLYRV